MKRVCPAPMQTPRDQVTGTKEHLLYERMTETGWLFSHLHIKTEVKSGVTLAKKVPWETSSQS